MYDTVTDDNNTRAVAERESKAPIDEIWVYGSSPQSKLADFSKSMANAVAANHGEETERLLNEAIKELDQSVLQEKKGFFGRFTINITKKYRETLKCIDDVNVNLRLRQAQLLKNTKIFEDMSDLISACVSELEIYIEVGKMRLSNLGDGENDDWKERFDRKIADLEMSHVIALQSIAQLQLMKKNYEVLIEKMNSILSNTIPLWRNQAAVAYGIERYEDSNLVQKKVLDAVEKITRNNENDLRIKVKQLKKSAIGQADIDRIKRINTRLEESLQDIKSLEQSIRGSAEKIDDILWKTSDIDKPITLSL